MIYRFSGLLLLLLCCGTVFAQLPYEVERTAFSNSVLDEFNPVLHKDTLLFYSNQENELFMRYAGSNKQPIFNLFFVQIGAEGEESKPEVFSQQFASPDNESPFTLSPDGHFIVYTRQLVAGKKADNVFKSDPAFGLFFGEKKKGIWQETFEFPYNSADFSFSTPCFSPDGSFLYFASDMPGGIGGMDLYRSEWKDSKWTEPVNLGDRINTEKNETYPFISESGLLFFASDGHEGVGKRDIFLSKMKEGEWIQPVHMHEPINSPEEDFAFITDADLKKGYFTSNRENSNDIYRFSTRIPQLFDCDIMLENNYCFEFWDDRIDGIDTLPVTYEWEFSDGQRERGLIVEHCLPGPGDYWARLHIIDNTTSNTFFTQSTMEFTLNDFEQAYINSNTAGLVGDSMYFDALQSKLPEAENVNYIWDMGDGKLGIGPEIIHAYQETGIYTVKLGTEISSPEFKNGQVACIEKQIQIVQNKVELAALMQGKDVKSPEIDKTQAENNEIQQDFSIFDVNPEEEVFRVEVLKSEEKIQINDTVFDPLRAEYEIKEFYRPEDSVYSYAVGEFDNLLSTYDIYSDVVGKGFNTASVQTYVLAELPTAIIEKINRAFAEIADANFEFDKAEVSEASYGVLDMVVEIMMDNPDLAMEIAAHTDNIGSFEYNMNLSQRRAESIVNYLVSKGIDRIRLIGKGYGEAMPIESNSTEEGRQMNRRVEFIILNEQ